MVFLEPTSHLFVLDSGAEGAGPDDNLQAMRKFAITVHAQAHERFGKLLPVVLYSHHKIESCRFHCLIRNDLESLLAPYTHVKDFTH